ncbi:MAG TPA: sigma factor, partial [Ferruginibacter sp.]|nr:sigma factor [Ferruginibacter sp.]
MSGQIAHNEEDRRLAMAIEKGDQRSLGQIYNKYAPALMGIISRIASSKEQADDILRTTFVQIWEQIRSFDASRSSLFTWLINVARRTALDEA